eukprot:TRINITY_DN114241_c0_g1_i1.p2 TRINITY_DN114241_c0_g1~~TRINITY_DN114241_c0_g1_i1.p2  ORF type:complete len:391 (+),score=145.42 TRINITY_DN114241_c0_g1_i1:83-1255(+)
MSAMMLGSLGAARRQALEKARAESAVQRAARDTGEEKKAHAAVLNFAELAADAATVASSGSQEVFHEEHGHREGGLPPTDAPDADTHRRASALEVEVDPEALRYSYHHKVADPGSFVQAEVKRIDSLKADFAAEPSAYDVGDERAIPPAAAEGDQPKCAEEQRQIEERLQVLQEDLQRRLSEVEEQRQIDERLKVLQEDLENRIAELAAMHELERRDWEEALRLKDARLGELEDVLRHRRQNCEEQRTRRRVELEERHKSEHSLWQEERHTHNEQIRQLEALLASKTQEPRSRVSSARLSSVPDVDALLRGDAGAAGRAARASAAAAGRLEQKWRTASRESGQCVHVVAQLLSSLQQLKHQVVAQGSELSSLRRELEEATKARALASASS